MSQIAGKVTIRLDGEMIATEVGGTLNVGGVEREARLSAQGVVGYKENPVAATIQATGHLTEGVDPVAIARITQASVLFETDNGHAWLLRRAFVTEPPEINTGEGTFSINFSGMGLERIS